MKNQKVSQKQKASYAICSGAGNFIITLISTFLTAYYTDTVGMAIAAIGTMMLYVRFLDDVIGVCALILDGTDDSADFPLIPLPQVVAAKAQGDDGLPLDGGLGNVIYDKYRVRR